MTEPEPIRVCVFCFTLVSPEEEIILVRLFDSTDGGILARGVGHADCGQKRWDLIENYTEVLERNRQDMPSSDPGDTQTLQETTKNAEIMENPESQSETTDSEVDAYFGKLKDT